jgi:simple sugar transport system permease protein
MTAAATRRDGLPAWADYGLLPLLNLAAAFLLSGLVVVMVGEDPVRALATLVDGAFGYGEAIGYTLYYATNFIFTGLAVAIAFHAGLFNIGGEGQAYIGGRRCSAAPGRRSRPICKPIAAATSSSPPSCSTSSPRR